MVSHVDTQKQQVWESRVTPLDRSKYEVLTSLFGFCSGNRTEDLVHHLHCGELGTECILLAT